MRRPSRRAVLLDVLLGLVLWVPVLGGDMIPPRFADGSWWTMVGGMAALAGAVAVSRSVPLASMLTATALIVIHGNFAFSLPVMAYLTGRRMVHARPVLWGFTGVLVGGTALNLVRGTDVTVWFPTTIWLVLIGVLPWLAGRYWRQYQELVHAGWERAEQLEREHRIVAERERLRERSRIAQDMHDSLGHELALIAVRAGALQVAPGLDERHREAAAELRAGAADATDQLRRIIGVLRVDTAPTAEAPPSGVPSTARPGLAANGADAPDGPDGSDGAPMRPARERITDLVDRAAASGIPVRLVGQDVPRTAAPMVAIAAHRVVQEAITNAAKHAPGAAVTVRLDHAPDGALTVTVRNGPAPRTGHPLHPPTGTATTHGHGGVSGGHGLTGLAERVRLVGGALTTGPTAEGGFRVAAELPGTDAALDASGAGPLTDLAPDGTGTGTRPVHLTGGPGTPGGAEAGIASESALRLARGRRQVQRGLITAIAVPAALLAVLSAVMVGYYLVVTFNSVLPPDRFAELRIGAPEADVERSLPSMESMSADTFRVQEPEPAGADCRYYRPNASLLGTSGRVYRLCFVHGRLMYKNILHPRDPDGSGGDPTP